MVKDDKWPDEECRYFFQLYMDERKKGNRPNSGMNKAGKACITKKFAERFGQTHIWDRFKNKYDTSRRRYLKFKRLIQNRTGLGYDAAGRLDMPDAWWDERIAEWPGAEWCRDNLTANLDLFELESVDKDVSVPAAKTQNRGATSKKKRKEADSVAEISFARNEILAKKNKIMEEMLEREHTYSVERVLEILNNLPGLKKWSPFHRAAIDHLVSDASNRQGFIAFASDEDKINYLEYRTGKYFYD